MDKTNKPKKPNAPPNIRFALTEQWGRWQQNNPPERVPGNPVARRIKQTKHRKQMEKAFIREQKRQFNAALADIGVSYDKRAAGGWETRMSWLYDDPVMAGLLLERQRGIFHTLLCILWGTFPITLNGGEQLPGEVRLGHGLGYMVPGGAHPYRGGFIYMDEIGRELLCAEVERVTGRRYGWQTLRKKLNALAAGGAVAVRQCLHGNAYTMVYYIQHGGVGPFVREPVMVRKHTGKLKRALTEHVKRK